jgi:hypothetical protein
MSELQKALSTVCWFSLLYSTLCAHTIQTPLPFEPYFRNQIFAFTGVPNMWDFDVIVGGYSRKANRAFGTHCEHLNSNPGLLAALFFNACSFTGAQALAGGVAPTPSINPFLNSLLSPRIKYTDSGAVIIGNATRAIADNCVVGVRAQIPLRNIKVTLLSCNGPGSSLLGGETPAQVTEMKQETIDGATVESFAYRLDFLSALPVDCQLPGLMVPFVNYHNSSFPDTAITISNLDVTDNSNLNNLPLGPDNRNAVTILQSTTIPQGILGVAQADVQTLPTLSADGTSLTQNGRARFSVGTDYTSLGANYALQTQMWVVPTVDVSQDALVSRANIIETQVQRLLMCIQTSPEEFFEECAGTSFACQNEHGIGDMDVDFFARYYWNNDALVEGFFGLRFPTGKKADPRAVFALPLGNGGHTELKIGGHACYQPCTWFRLNSDILYSHVCKNQESVAAPFQGATVKNLGPIICANVGWNYLEAHVDATCSFVVCQCMETAFHLGYEVYQKWRDHVSFGIPKAIDCFGTLQPLYPCLLTAKTKALSQKVYGDFEIGYTPTLDMGFRLFVGFDVVVTGHNIPKEHGFHIGIECSWNV